MEHSTVISTVTGVAGFEPTTVSFRANCAANCATPQCPWRDSNPHACAPDPKSGVSTISTTRAYLLDS